MSMGDLSTGGILDWALLSNEAAVKKKMARMYFIFKKVELQI
jgi:hypothetical protein